MHDPREILEDLVAFTTGAPLQTPLGSVAKGKPILIRASAINMALPLPGKMGTILSVGTMMLRVEEMITVGDEADTPLGGIEIPTYAEPPATGSKGPPTVLGKG